MAYFFKTAALVVIGLCVFAAASAAEKMYVSDDLRITFRTGPGNDRKILSILRSGRALEVLRTEGDWSQVRLSTGEEGWVLTRYLSDEEPCAMTLERLQNEFERLEQRNDVLTTENAQLKSENSQLKNAAEKRQEALESVTRDYETLREESTQYLTLKAAHEKATARLAAQTKRADTLDEELGRALRRQHIRWFLSGAGVMVLGIVIGLLTRREKRRSSLL